MSGDDPIPASHTDGRRANRERNLLAVVDAMLELYAEGNLDPGAQEVADRSGVSRRSVFRYFDDMEALGRFAIRIIEERLAPYLTPDTPVTASLPDRIHALARQRAAHYRHAAPAARVMRVRAPFKPLMRQELERNRKFFNDQVAAYFAAELDDLPPDVRRETLAAVQLLYAFESFEFLTANHSSLPEARAAIERTVTALFAAALGNRTS